MKEITVDADHLADILSRAISVIEGYEYGAEEHKELLAELQAVSEEAAVEAGAGPCADCDRSYGPGSRCRCADHEANMRDCGNDCTPDHPCEVCATEEDR